jgi:broad specificity polyphosphatase/5'/3'-nucleotidase SurE
MPALAASQASPAPGGHPDFASGVNAVVSWVQEHEVILFQRGMSASLTSMNIPTCETGEIRGVARDMPLALDCAGALDLQDCLSDVDNPTTDIEALINGFVSIGPISVD